MAQQGLGPRVHRRAAEIAHETSSAAGAAIAVVWLAASAFALRSAEPKFCKFPLTADTISGNTFNDDIGVPPPDWRQATKA
jgi:hypothetical protein